MTSILTPTAPGLVVRGTEQAGAVAEAVLVHLAAIDRLGIGPRWQRERDVAEAFAKVREAARLYCAEKVR